MPKGMGIEIQGLDAKELVGEQVLEQVSLSKWYSKVMSSER